MKITKITTIFNVLLANICCIVFIWNYNAATFRKRVIWLSGYMQNNLQGAKLCTQKPQLLRIADQLTDFAPNWEVLPRILWACWSANFVTLPQYHQSNCCLGAVWQCIELHCRQDSPLCRCQSRQGKLGASWSSSCSVQCVYCIACFCLTLLVKYAHLHRVSQKK